jgi:hypothetical protein
VLEIERGRDDFDAERAQARRIVGLVGRHLYFESGSLSRAVTYFETRYTFCTSKRACRVQGSAT